MRIGFQTGVLLEQGQTSADIVSDTLQIIIDELIRQDIKGIYHYNSADVELYGKTPVVRAAVLKQGDKNTIKPHKNLYVSEIRAVNLNSFDIIFIRGDDIEPCLEKLVSAYDHVLPESNGGPKIINPIDAAMTTKDKYELWKRGKDDLNLPFTYLAQDLEDAISAAEEAQLKTGQKYIIVKYRYGSGGKQVHRLDATKKGCKNALKKLLHRYNNNIILQGYVPAVAETGDIRAILLDGEIIGAVNRRGRKLNCIRNWKVNVYRGGKVYPHTLSEEEIEYSKKVAAKFPEARLLGIDILKANGKYTCWEINTTPGGLRYITVMEIKKGNKEFNGGRKVLEKLAPQLYHPERLLVA